MLPLPKSKYETYELIILLCSCLIFLFYPYFGWEQAYSLGEKNYDRVVSILALSGLILISFTKNNLFKHHIQEQNNQNEPIVKERCKCIYKWLLFCASIILLIKLMRGLIYGSINEEIWDVRNHTRTVLVVIVEELAYRSALLFPALNIKFKNQECGDRFKGVFVLISACIFTFFHFNYVGMCGIQIELFVIGIIYGCIYVISENIWIPILFHFLNNLLGIILVI